MHIICFLYKSMWVDSSRCLSLPLSFPWHGFEDFFLCPHPVRLSDCSRCIFSFILSFIHAQILSAWLCQGLLEMFGIGATDPMILLIIRAHPALVPHNQSLLGQRSHSGSWRSFTRLWLKTLIGSPWSLTIICDTISEKNRVFGSQWPFYR